MPLLEALIIVSAALTELNAARPSLCCCCATSEKTGLAEEFSYAASARSKLLYFATVTTIAFALSA